MGWVAGTPTVPVRGSEEGAEDSVPAGRRGGARPSAWVLPTSRMAGQSPSRVRIDTVMLLSTGTAYLLFAALLVLLEAIHAAVTNSTASTSLQDLRGVLVSFGWLGMMAGGFILYFLPLTVGIPYRPAWVARAHLVVANIGLLGYSGAVLVSGNMGMADVFLALVALSYILFAIPLVLALVIAAQEWRAGVL